MNLTNIINGKEWKTNSTSHLLPMSFLLTLGCSSTNYAPVDGTGMNAYASAKVYVDADGDGVRAAIDCDDTDASIGRPYKWYRDRDSDGYGTRRRFVFDCAEPVGYVSNGQDCNDRSSSVYFGAPEYCNGVDDNCDRTTDEDTSLDAIVWYLDSDGDGYGDVSYTTSACSVPSGYVSDATDCDDSTSLANPSLTEVCGDTYDNDCDGTANSCSLSGTSSLSSYDAKLTGEAASDVAGYSVAGAGDVNFDGYADLLIGAHGEDSDTSRPGSAYLVLGPVTGEVSLSSAYAQFDGETNGDIAGFPVSSAGDTNNDGYDDMLIGAHRESTGGSWAGAMYVVLGPTSGGIISLSSADAKVIGEEAGAYLGFPVAAAGDINSDGYADVLTAAHMESTGGTRAGAAYLLTGPISGTMSVTDATAKFIGEDTWDYAGNSLAGMGDVSGDGIDDILIGAYLESSAGSYAGAAYFFNGSTSLTGDIDLSAADVKYTGEVAGDYLGYFIGRAGDTNDDGYNDLLMGAFCEDSGGTDAGAAYIVLGPASSGTLSISTADAKLIGESSGDYAGYSVSGVDLNGDFYFDIVVGAHYNDSAATDAGAVYLVNGPVSGTVNLSAADAIWRGEAASDLAGRFIGNAGDVNADTLDDLVVGAQSNDGSATNAGAAYLIHGSGL